MTPAPAPAPNRFMRWLSAQCFLFAGITAMLLSPDPVIRWLGGSLFILMSFHSIWSQKLESSSPDSASSKRRPATYPLTLVIAVGWLALVLLTQMYVLAALFIALFIYGAWQRLRSQRTPQNGSGV